MHKVQLSIFFIPCVTARMGLVKETTLVLIGIIVIIALCLAAFPTYLVVDRILGGDDIGEAVEEHALTS